MTGAAPERDPVVNGGARPTTVLFVAGDRAESIPARFAAMLAEYAPGEFEVAGARAAADAIVQLQCTPTECAVVFVRDAEPESLVVVETIAARVPGVALVVLTDLPEDRLGISTAHGGKIDLLAQDTLDAKFLVTSVRYAILRKRLEVALDEVQAMARIGTWRADLARGDVEFDPDGHADRLFGTAQDITDQDVRADAPVHQELHDPLTGLPNRRLLVDRLGQALARLAREATSVAVMHLGIDRFEVVNDSLGHSVGDSLLLATATRLRYFVRPEDTLARIESDEFVLLCEGLAGADEAVAIADRICAAMALPIEWQGGDLVLSVSAGVALATSPSVDGDALLRDADAAMHRAQHEGGARSAIFATAMHDNVIRRLDTETSLRHSIGNGDLRVHYQPVVSLTDGQVLGHEALVRWDHPSRGLLGPDEFITIAEETGLIIPVGAWVLRAACRQAKRFQDRDPKWPRLTMSVNLSGAQLGQADLLDLIRSALRDADLDAEDLQLEMTESVLMNDAATTVNVLQSLKDLGVRLSIDDFGTGYSSLAYLRRFPVDVLKIDRTFVGGLGKDLEDSAIVAAVVNLADTLGFTTVAEGVETELQRRCLVDLGCTRAQGYLFAQPSAAPEAEALLDHASGAVANRR
ncbi:MAG: hypothetical protein QOE62_3591 [Actinomycetota bacterium]|nr:hypothetical protein [Actinomycetota bacterium]